MSFRRRPGIPISVWLPTSGFLVKPGMTQGEGTKAQRGEGTKAQRQTGVLIKPGMTASLSYWSRIKSGMIRYPGRALDSWLAAYLWIPDQARNDTRGRHKGTKGGRHKGTEADWSPDQARNDSIIIILVPDQVRDDPVSRARSRFLARCIPLDSWSSQE